MPQGYGIPDKGYLAQVRSGEGLLEEESPEPEGREEGRKRSWQGLPRKEDKCRMGQRESGRTGGASQAMAGPWESDMVGQSLQ